MLKIGSVVKIIKKNVDCFVEHIILEKGWGNKENQQEVSLYDLNGKYMGDYWENELISLNGIISDELLIKLLKDNIEHYGLVKDFARVLTLKNIKEDD